jgi:transcriptional regulator of acetoin/glycerol metabolism
VRHFTGDAAGPASTRLNGQSGLAPSRAQAHDFSVDAIQECLTALGRIFMTALSENPTASAFDQSAQERIGALFRNCAPEDFIRALLRYTPATRDEEVVFEKYYGWAFQELGEYKEARRHMFRALRRSRPGSRDRAHLRGLLGYGSLNMGRVAVAERCSERALSDLPRDDDGYLRAGHLGLRGRIYRAQGHLTPAIEATRRALACIDGNSPHFTQMTIQLVHALQLRGDLHEADVLARAQREAFARGDCVGLEWHIAETEALLALELGEIDRADRIIETSLSNPVNATNQRTRFILQLVQAEIMQARKQWAPSEALLRSVLEHCSLGDSNGDLIADAARGLAESLEAQGKLEAAIEQARLSVRAGSVADRYEKARGLHVLGRCLAAVGQKDEARRVFQEAVGLHEPSEYATERARLEETMMRLGFGDLTSRGREQRVRQAAVSRLGEPQRVSLADGRIFLTLDRRLLSDIRIAAAGELPVLIEGETGTGKELVARLLHEMGPRAGGRFVIVDCATLSAELADVELFGATRGAYTGAYRDRKGLVAQADGGTLFLDELPELSSALQAKLLRLLQEGTYRRVGEDTLRSARVRFVAATNRSVNDLLRGGALKPDLFYRLNGYRVTLRPLRERREEIGPLVDEFVHQFGLAGVSPAAHRTLEAYHWPGNIRQLEMILRVAAGRCALGATLRWEDLVLQDLGSREPTAEGATLRAGRLEWERAALLQALRANGGVLSKTARSLGMTRQAVYQAMRRTGLRREDISVNQP